MVYVRDCLCVLRNEQPEEGEGACIGPSAREAGDTDWYISQADVASTQEGREQHRHCTSYLSRFYVHFCSVHGKFVWIGSDTVHLRD